MTEREPYVGDVIVCPGCGKRVRAVVDHTSNLTYLRADDGALCVDGSVRHEWPTGAVPIVEPIAFVGLSAYIVLGDDVPNVLGWEPTADPDSYGDDVLRELMLPSNGVHLSFRLTGGDDYADGLTSYDYLAEVSTMDDLRSFVDYANGTPDDPNRNATPNMGLLIGPEEYGWIPGGLTWSLDGMAYNVGGLTRIAGVDCSAFPITVEAVTYLGMMEGGEA